MAIAIGVIALGIFFYSWSKHRREVDRINNLEPTVENFYVKYGETSPFDRCRDVIAESLLIIEKSEKDETIIYRMKTVREMLQNQIMQIHLYNDKDKWVPVLKAEKEIADTMLLNKVNEYCAKLSEDSYLKKKNGDYKKGIDEKLFKKVYKLKGDLGNEYESLNELEQLAIRIKTKAA